jgi:hypothetical protein
MGFLFKRLEWKKDRRACNSSSTPSHDLWGVAATPPLGYTFLPWDTTWTCNIVSACCDFRFRFPAGLLPRSGTGITPAGNAVTGPGGAEGEQKDVTELSCRQARSKRARQTREPDYSLACSPAVRRSLSATESTASKLHYLHGMGGAGMVKTSEVVGRGG